MIVRGANITLGYLRADNRGVIEAPEDGWYPAGGIVEIDDEAFPDQDHAVIAVPDKKKGEKLVLFTADKSIDRKQLLAGMKQTDAIEMMIPREVVHVDAIPVLRTAKVDYVATNKMAKEREAA